MSPKITMIDKEGRPTYSAIEAQWAWKVHHTNPSLHPHGKGEQIMKTQADIRNAFWQTFFVEGKPREYYGKRQNDLPVDLRMAFVDYIDGLRRDGIISDKLAARVTL